jgi:hypothetical protein
MNALLYNAPLYIIRADDKRRGRLKTEKGEVAGPIQEKQV